MERWRKNWNILSIPNIILRLLTNCRESQNRQKQILLKLKRTRSRKILKNPCNNTKINWLTTPNPQSRLLNIVKNTKFSSLLKSWPSHIPYYPFISDRNLKKSSKNLDASQEFMKCERWTLYLVLILTARCLASDCAPFHSFEHEVSCKWCRELESNWLRG